MGTTAVVMAIYNGEAHLEAALDSLNTQTKPATEIVVVDDGSSDQTVALLRERGIEVLTPPHAGAPAARNTGRRALVTNPDYILFLDQDDVLHPTMLEALGTYLDEHPRAGLAYCRMDLIDGYGRPIPGPSGWPPRHAPGRFGRPHLLPDSEPLTPLLSILDFVAILPSASLLRLSAFDRAGGWNERFVRGGAADTALAVEIGLAAEVHYVPEALVSYRFHPTQESAGRERLQHAQNALLAELRERPDPRLRRALRAYDTQLSVQRLVNGVLEAARRRDWQRALTTAAGARHIAARGLVGYWRARR